MTGLGVQEGLIDKLSAGAQSGRAAAAEKQLEKMRAEGLIEKPYVAKKRSFAFPSAEGMGQRVLSIHNLSHGYQDRMLFQGADLEVERGDRVAIIGEHPMTPWYVSSVWGPCHTGVRGEVLQDWPCLAAESDTMPRLCSIKPPR